MRYNLSYTFCFLALSRSAISSPLWQRDAKGISNTDFEKIQLYGQYAAASYCPANFNHLATASKITCRAHNCGLVEEAETRIIDEFADIPSTGTTGYIAIDNTHKVIIVSFRGSNTLANWMANFDLRNVPVDLCKGCRGASGFWRSWTDVRNRIIRQVKVAREEKPEYKIVVTGHSLGGAVATFAAVDLRNMGFKDVDMASFGAPRVANQAFVDFVGAQGQSGPDPNRQRNFRVTHNQDPVPNVPYLEAGYRHITPTYFISTDNTQVPTAAEVQVIAGSHRTNPQPSQRDLLLNSKKQTFAVSAHLFYGEPISACSSDPRAAAPFVDLPIRIEGNSGP